MTVRELIDKLLKMPLEADVEVHVDEEFHGFTVGELHGDPAGPQMVPLYVD